MLLSPPPFTLLPFYPFTLLPFYPSYLLFYSLTLLELIMPHGLMPTTERLSAEPSPLPSSFIAAASHFWLGLLQSTV